LDLRHGEAGPQHRKRLSQRQRKTAKGVAIEDILVPSGRTAKGGMVGPYGSPRRRRDQTRSPLEGLGNATARFEHVHLLILLDSAPRRLLLLPEEIAVSKSLAESSVCWWERVLI
jgi:hypothetical protein